MPLFASFLNKKVKKSRILMKFGAEKQRLRRANKICGCLKTLGSQSRAGISGPG
ncbi:MAG: hypothetical protein KDD06_23285 [Phaeodactylibacter sp.]|nr:hypothetical protein [Phaeodactylibacter sp.]MCB9265061.1 hypothetical protein [Lewinellaceae bacterium]MCB9287404.1 hypothetical protein [Lewinellaceae bacterium]